MNVAKLAKRAGTTVLKKMGPAGKAVSRHIPEIGLGLGIASVVGGTVTACRATLKVQDILDKREEEMRELAEAVDDLTDEEVESYSDDDRKRDKLIVQARCAWSIAREYALPVSLMGLGIGLTIGSHKMVTDKLAAVTAAYSLLDQGFRKYRERVRAELGEDKDREFRLGVHDVEVVEVKQLKNGKDKEVTRTISGVSPTGLSVYSRFWDEYNVCDKSRWSPSREVNRDFLHHVQNQLNDKLQRVGHVWLYEAYEMLGLDYDGPVTEGIAHTVGWCLGMGDDYVDLGLYEAYNEDAMSSRYTDKANESIIIDPNVDGVITDWV